MTLIPDLNNCFNDQISQQSLFRKRHSHNRHRQFELTSPSLPIKNQNPYIRAALSAGKHVLSEKPVAENIQEAVETIKWYRSEISGPSWCVAENWRFLNSYAFASQEVKKLGKIIGFQVRSFGSVQTDNMWYSELDTIK